MPLDCINHTAIIYQVPATIIISALKQKNGRNGMRLKIRTVDEG
jgi:hypothetical protein